MIPCATAADWTRYYSVSGTFDGLVASPRFLAARAARGVTTLAAAPAIPFEGWDGYACPILDQRQTGMCQSFSSMIGLSTLLRAKLDPYFLAGEIDVIADDLCLDPRVGHRLGRERYAPGEPYTPREGLPAGTTIDVLRDAGLVSPGTTNPPVAWADVPACMDLGLPELPLFVTDAFDPRRMSDHGEIGPAADPTAIRGGHSMRCIGTARDAAGRWMLKGANSWAHWGRDGYFWISLRRAEGLALDMPRLLQIADPEWYANHTEWRSLLCLKTDLDAWLRAA